MHAAEGTSVGVVDPKLESVAEEVVDLIAELSPRKRVAVDALLVGHSVTKTAELAGCHRGTVSRWIAEDAAFNAALNALEREAIRLGNIRLMSLIPTAIMMIENALNKGDVRAAYQLLKLALYSRRQVGPASPDLVQREMEVAKLQQEMTLQKQQADFQEITEDAIVRSKKTTQETSWRVYCEKLKQKEEAEWEERQLRKAEAARQAADANANPSPNPAAQRQPTPPANEPPGESQHAKPASEAPVTPASKHPGQAGAAERDSRIKAAVRSAAGSLGLAGLTPGTLTTSSDVTSATNPGKPQKV